MKRVWFLSAIGVVGVAAFVQLTRSDAVLTPSAQPERSEVVEAQPLPAVRVEHLLVQAEVVTSPEPPPAPVGISPDLQRSAVVPVAAKPITGRAASLRSTQADSRTPPLLFERAKRAFLGNGRHRPEPFPRVKDN